jgi:hypothetical protein
MKTKRVGVRFPRRFPRCHEIVTEGRIDAVNWVKGSGSDVGKHDAVAQSKPDNVNPPTHILWGRRVEAIGGDSSFRPN